MNIRAIFTSFIGTIREVSLNLGFLGIKFGRSQSEDFPASRSRLDEAVSFIDDDNFWTLVWLNEKWKKDGNPWMYFRTLADRRNTKPHEEAALLAMLEDFRTRGMVDRTDKERGRHIWMITFFGREVLAEYSRRQTSS